ncbi:MAG: HD domain-containing protein, partial [Ruminiclostridium sp.]|nr:HD domain-containing protein [Ruminiclostridium sp.]
VKARLRFMGWMQKPMSDETAGGIKDMKCRVTSVRTKIMSVIISALVLLATSATAISFVLFRNAVIDQQKKLVNCVSATAALEVNGDMVDEYLAHSYDVPGYSETEKSLYNLLNSDEDIKYIYVYKIMEDGCHVVFDLDTPYLEAEDPGAVIELDEAALPYRGDLLSGKPVEPIISDDSFGWLITEYKPIYDSRGICVAYAAADVSMYNIGDSERNFLTGMISLYLAFFIVIFAVVLWVIEYHIVLPVNSMSMVASRFAFDSTDDKLDANVRNMRDLDIHTGDEIENLYNAVLKTASDSVGQVEAIRQKSETISKMQNALVLVLANIVENRDKNTGDHVRKTAAYSRVIMKEMKKRGCYPDLLTDSFIENVSNTAPMHDIGKIKVSDMILNKPGRLTDDEFRIMQEHTTYGREIIDEVIDLVPGSDYLREARDLAYYHHEKWNGKGYPEGISGEDIPLSARVMAVADVFDALVSKRSYKEPFSFEQARDIIREGAGVHFDPLVAEA